MKLRLPLLSCIIILLCQFSNAQPTWLWGETYGSSGDEYPFDMITDAAGNIYVTGVVADTCYLGSDTLYGTTSTSGSAFGHAYIAKYDSSGNVLWATGPEEAISYSRFYNLVMDEAGNLYVSGYQYDSITWQGNVYPSFGYTYLIMKLNSQGEIQWVKQQNTHFNHRPIVYENGKLWMMTYNSSTFTLDTVTITFPPSADRDLIVYSLDTASGAATSGFRLGLNGIQYSRDMAIRNGQLYISGITNDTLNVGSDSVYVSSGYKPFLVKSDLLGNMSWVTSLYRNMSGAFGTEQEIKIGPGGNVYYFQEFSNTIDIEDTSITSLGSRDLLLSKYNSSNGNLIYFQHMGSTNFEIVGGLQPLSNGRVIVSGRCSTPFFSNGENKGFFGGNRPFIAEYGADGTYLNFTNSNSGFGTLDLLSELPDNKIVGFGVYQTNVVFSSVSLSGTFKENMLIVGEMDSCSVPKPAILVVSGCSTDSVLLKTDVSGYSFSWSTGDTLDSIYVQNDGLYSVIISDTNNCSAFSDPKSVEVDESLTLNTSDSIFKCIEDSIWINTNKDGPVNWSTGVYADSIYVKLSQAVFAIDSISGCQIYSDTLLIKDFPRDSNVVLTYSDTGFCPQSSILVTTTNTYSSHIWMNGLTSSSILVNTTNPVYVEITDNNGCIGYSDTLIPLAYTSPTPVIVQNDTTICIGDSITLSTAQSYNQYLWNTSATSQSIWVNQAMNYSVMVTDSNGCSATTSGTQINIQPLPSFTLSHQGSNAVCGGQSVFLSASDTTYQYSWNTTQTGDSILILQNGMYSAVATDSVGCMTSSDTVDFVLSDPIADITPQGDTAFCTGGSVDLNGTPGMVGYSWSTGNNTPNVTVTSSQLVTLIVTDSVGCKDTSESLQVTAFPLPAKPIITVSGNDLTTSAIGQLLWLLNSTPISGSTGNAITVTSNGTYSVSVTDSNSCSNVSDPFSFTWLGITDLTSADLTIYPNPVGDVLYVNSKLNIERIRVFDMNGAKVMDDLFDGDKNASINVSTLENGSYIIMIQSISDVFREVFVKE